ncbi:MAG: hypothetical protein GWN61_23400, partial [candidate division Zixibacteria bacterium]|nr:hypothetical protein [candidate division KSB1 bacterium]NIR67541.1 hypothetical protein [candidate division Zixibacteria bacterium]NIS45191.1 hypothetical protein [candidate division Zixibacteria bacterium]NIT72098.1 hypothetical protein [candidate division KSB1 bacterium]NIU12969.1 hypothetical protein [candidate division Zixibacteria bacterium]
ARNAWEWFFKRREDYEANHFAPSDSLPARNRPLISTIPAGRLNAPETARALRSINPDLIVLFDTSLMNSSTLDLFQKRVLNMHIGLSSHYRGSSANFWPIHDGRLECLGATIMCIDNGIDTGEVLAQEAIQVESCDTEQSLMGKTIILGVNLLIQILRNWETASTSSLPLEDKGKLYLKKDFNPQTVLKVREMVEGGGLERLINHHLKT